MGAGATVVCGVTLGEYCMVGSGRRGDEGRPLLRPGRGEPRGEDRLGLRLWRDVSTTALTALADAATPWRRPGKGFGSAESSGLTLSPAAANTYRPSFVYRGLSIVAVAPVLDEQVHIAAVVRRTPRPLVDELIVADDGSRDGTADIARGLGATVLSAERTVGVGAVLRLAYAYARERGYDVVVTMAGNNKDSPEEIPKLLDPIADGRADFVQGSRFLDPRAGFGDMPFYRRVATRLHPLLFSLVAGKRVSESTNGFRAMRVAILGDPRLNLDQPWLDAYELEPYLYLRVIRLGYETAEVPVTKRYPPRQLGQTKMRPFTDWWSILRPLFLLGLGLRK